MPRILDFRYGQYPVKQLILNGKVIWERLELVGQSENEIFTLGKGNGIAVQLKLCKTNAEFTNLANGYFNVADQLFIATQQPTTIYDEKAILRALKFPETNTVSFNYSYTSEDMVAAMIIDLEDNTVEIDSFTNTFGVIADMIRGKTEIESYSDDDSILRIGYIKKIKSEETIDNNELVYGHIGIIKKVNSKNEIKTNENTYGLSGQLHKVLSQTEQYSYTDYIARIPEQYETRGQAEIWLHGLNAAHISDRKKLIGESENHNYILSFGLSNDKVSFIGYADNKSLFQGFQEAIICLSTSGQSENITKTINYIFAAKINRELAALQLISNTNSNCILNKVLSLGSNGNNPLQDKTHLSLQPLLYFNASSNTSSLCSIKDTCLWYPPIGFPATEGEFPIIGGKGVVLNKNDGVEIDKKRKKIKIRQAYSVLTDTKNKILEVT